MGPCRCRLRRNRVSLSRIPTLLERDRTLSFICVQPKQMAYGQFWLYCNVVSLKDFLYQYCDVRVYNYVHNFLTACWVLELSQNSIQLCSWLKMQIIVKRIVFECHFTFLLKNDCRWLKRIFKLAFNDFFHNLLWYFCRKHSDMANVSLSMRMI